MSSPSTTVQKKITLVEQAPARRTMTIDANSGNIEVKMRNGNSSVERCKKCLLRVQTGNRDYTHRWQAKLEGNPGVNRDHDRHARSKPA